VYGLVADARSEEAAERLYALKGRALEQPTALVANDVESLVACIPEVSSELLIRGPYTLIVPNPARRFAWLTGANPAAIGVRIPELTGPGADVLARVGVVVATSANHPGKRDPATLDDVPEAIRRGAGAVVEGSFAADATFVATQVIAKHDEVYTAPKAGATPAHRTSFP